MKTLIGSVARHPVLSNLLMILVLFGGFFYFATMRREASPQIRIDRIQVIVPFPGASAVEVEEGIITKIETALQGVFGIETIEASSTEGGASLLLTLADGLSAAVKQQTLIDVRSHIEQISDFPAGAEKPKVTELMSYSEVFLLVLYGDAPEKILREKAFDLRDDLKRLGISKIELSGVRRYELTIEVSEQMLQKWQLTLADVAEVVRRGSLNLPGGSIRTNKEEYRIEIRGRRYQANAYRNLTVISRTDGTTVRLEQIAQIHDTFEQDQSQGRFDGKPAVLLMVFCVGNEDMLEISRRVSRYLGEYQADICLTAPGVKLAEVAAKIRTALGEGSVSCNQEQRSLQVTAPLYTGSPLGALAIPVNGSMQPLRQIAKVREGFALDRQLPYGVKIAILADFSRLVKERIGLLLTNGWQGLLLVVLALWLFLNLRVALWVAAGLPVAFAFAGIVMGVQGASLNMISMFGLVMVLGIVVDDAIVIAENVANHRRQGKPPMEAAIAGTAEMGWPVIAAVATTMIAFMPLFFIRGVMGKFIAILPVAVVATLTGSLLEGLFILPAHLGHEKTAATSTPGWSAQIRQKLDQAVNAIIHRIYAPLYYLSLQSRYLTVALVWVALCFSLGLVASGLVAYVMFPEEDTLFVQAELAFAEGTSFEITRDAVEKIEAAARQINHRYGAYGTNGILVTGIYAEAGSGEGGQHRGNVYLVLVGPEKRRMHSRQIVDRWREMTGTIAHAQKLKFQSLGGGGPGTADVQLFLSGKDLEELRQVAREVALALADIPGVYDVQNDFQPGKRELLINLTPQGKFLGLSLRDIAEQLQQGFYGIEVAKLQRGRDEVKVKIRYPASERDSLADLYDVRLRAPSGQSYRLHEVATVQQDRALAFISRRNNARRVAVEAKVDAATTTPNQVITTLQRKVLPKSLQKYSGVSVDFGGTDAENKKALLSLLAGFAFALLAIFAVLALIFRSYLQPLLIMVTIPLGMIGAICGHWLLGYPLTLLSFFGIVALAGVVVNDALVLIERINEGQRSGIAVMESVRQAGPLRFRAIVLTSATTVAGLLPVLAEKSFQAQSLKPMALSLAGGLIFATILTLFVVPALYLVLNDARRLLHWLRHGQWPSAEEVEPAIRSN